MENGAKKFNSTRCNLEGISEKEQRNSENKAKIDFFFGQKLAIRGP
jgi:hypothetical protein